MYLSSTHSVLSLSSSTTKKMRAEGWEEFNANQTTSELDSLEVPSLMTSGVSRSSSVTNGSD